MHSLLKRWSILKWLSPGMRIKRWLGLLIAGIVFLSLAAAYVLVDIYRSQPLPPYFYYLTFQFIPRIYRALILFGLATISITVSLYKLGHSLISPFLLPRHGSVVDFVYQRRVRERGPKVVVIGGGTGLSTLLRGMKEHTDRLTAIVTVADDGGSSGELRRKLGVLPPGDLRNCITALADAESLTTQLFQYRFGQGTGLDGHSFGNLFIAAMSEITGDFPRAVAESCSVLAVRGRIIPSTLRDVTLCAELVPATEITEERAYQVEGESRIPESGLPIDRVFLRPESAQAYPEAIRALLQADLIVVGPGSLYTSVMPNLLVRGIVDAIRVSPAFKVYVCNIATQPGETDGYSVSDHVRALRNHAGPKLCDIVLANDNLSGKLPPSSDSELVRADELPPGEAQLITADLAEAENNWRHDSRKLAQRLMQVMQEFGQVEANQS